MATKLFVAAFSVIVSTLLIEIGLRLFVPEPLPPLRRALLWSPEFFELDGYGAVRHHRDRTLREAAVYNTEIEYDTLFETNNWGFIDSQPYVEAGLQDDGVERIAIVGDSFTAGVHGGEPWVPQLRPILHQNGNLVEVYNLGVSATGLDHFVRLLKSVSHQVAFDHVVLTPISGDFERAFWTPLSSPKGVHLCSENSDPSTCLQSLPIARALRLDMTQEELLQTAVNHFKDADSRLRSHPFTKVLKYSRLVRFILYRLRNRQVRHSLGTNTLSEHSQELLFELTKIFPNATLHLIHLPQKHEVAQRRYETTITSSLLKEHNIHYFPALERCDWNEQMFHLHDSHPNKEGYKSILECVSHYLLNTLPIGGPR